MSNILYIGPYREFSGMGNAARKYIQALHRAGHHVSIRPIYNIFKPYPESEIGKEILDLEKNSSTSYHICVQHCYPHQFYYTSKPNKIIGIMHLESINYKKDIYQYCSIVDELVVGSVFCRNSLVGCGVEKPIHVIPEPIDLDAMGSFREFNPKKTDGFTFYSLADFSLRKNLLTLSLAHSILSTKYDYINLIIKTKHKNLAEFSIPTTHIKDSMDIYATVFSRPSDNKRQPRIIVGETEYKNILQLHNCGDCYVDLSAGESFGYPALEAMAFDNNIIANEDTGTSDLIEDFGLTVSCENIHCEDDHKPYYMYNTVFQTWQKPNIHDLVEKMEMAVLESETSKASRIEKQRQKLKRCSVDSVADMLRDL